MPKITTLLFDCDNTLVLSEAIAFESCAELSNEILASKGVTETYTGPQLMVDFVGQNFRGIVSGLEKKYGFDLTHEEREGFVLQEEDRVIANLKKRAVECEGCTPELEKVQGKYKLAVVSSSAKRRVKASVEKVGQDKFFADDVIFSAATSLPKPTTKPDPAIYLFACETLGVKPGECVAIEDSKSGTLSAVRAGIPTIAYTGSYEDPSKADDVAKMLMDLGAKVHMSHWREFQDCLAKIEAS